MRRPLAILAIEDCADDTPLVVREAQAGSIRATHERVNSAQRVV
jgi:hypothetical protein